MRAFEHQVCRLLGNFRFASTHDTTNRHRGFSVADGRHGGVESAFFPVERCDLLAFATGADDDLRSTEPRAIERMHWLIQLEHGVIRGVIHVADGVLPDGSKSGL